jgi:ubiquinone/menaquinone biosynthesis C-methylase UbiE
MQSNAALLKARTTYNAAADHFDDAPLGFWDRHGRRAVELLSLQPGARVLEVGCGTGASALPAAAAVGPAGFVLGLDVADKLLARARDKALSGGFDNVSFECRDMTASGLPDAHFDAVISVFSIFFVEDMGRLLAELWRMLRPGGKLAVTTWGRDAFEPCAGMFREEVLRKRPGQAQTLRPWERLSDEHGIRGLFNAAGLSEPAVQSVSDRQPLCGPDDWWTIALASGYRYRIDSLTPEERRQLRMAVRQRISIDRSTAINTNAIHAIATRPAIGDSSVLPMT